MKIGIYGGTFDPPHNGHVNACKCFIDSIDIDKLFIIPTSIPPHKIRTSTVGGLERLEMAKLAFSGISEKIEFSNVELERTGKSYTADTLRHFKKMGASEIFLLCGTDMLVTLDEWYDFEYIFKAATIVYTRRERDEHFSELIDKKVAEYVALYNAKILYIDADVVEISSSDIRKAIAEGCVTELIPDSVYRYIESRSLYRND